MATGLDHVQTLGVCEWTFYACALAAIVIVRMGSLALQWGSVGVSILAIIGYTVYVYAREKGWERNEAPPNATKPTPLGPSK